RFAAPPPAAAPPAATAPDPGGAWQLAIAGMTCASCAVAVEKALAAVPGVKSAAVNLASEVATVVPGHGFEPDAAVRAVPAAGYHATPRRPGMPATERESRRPFHLLLLAAALSAPLLVIAMGGARFPGSDWVQLALATVIVFVAGGQFFAVAARK